MNWALILESQILAAIFQLRLQDICVTVQKRYIWQKKLESIHFEFEATAL